MSRERFVVKLDGSGTWERKSGDDYARERAADRLREMPPDRVLEIPDPDRGGVNAKFVYDQERGTFIEAVTDKDVRERRKPREYSFDVILDVYLKNQSFARFSDISGARRRIEIALGQHDAGEYHYPQVEKAVPKQPKESEQPQPPFVNEALISRQEKGRELALRVRGLYPGERVSVWSEKDRRLIYLEKSSFGGEVTFTEVTQFGGGRNERHAVVFEFRMLTLAEVEAMAAANPEVVVFEESAAIRERVKQKEQYKQRLAKLPQGQSIIIGQTMYTKGRDGTFSSTYLQEQRREGGTKMLGLVRLSEIAVQKRLEEASLYDEIHFVEEGERGVGVFEETDAELKQVHARFAALLPSLYKGLDSTGFGGKVKAIFGGASASVNREKVLEHYRNSGDIEQGQIGLCFALGGAFALKRTHPELYFDMLARSLRREGNTWQVRFMGYEKLGDQEKQKFNSYYPDGWIPVSDKEVSDWKEGIKVGEKTKSASEADEADIILERAYLSYRSYFKAGENVGQTFIADADGDLAAEGGNGNRALFDMLGPLVEKWKISPYNHDTAYSSLDDNGYASDARDFFEDEFKNNPELYVATVGTPSYKKGAKGEEKYLEYTEPDTGRKMRLPKKHAYAVLGVRQHPGKELQIRIADPHDTKKKQFWMNLSDFTATYSDVSYVKVLSDFRRNDPAAKRILKESYE